MSRIQKHRNSRNSGGRRAHKELISQSRYEKAVLYVSGAG